MERELTPSPESGVTLIELVIVVAVMATLAVGVTLAAGRPGTGAGDDRALFRAQFDTARALAVLEGRRRGLAITPQGRQAMALGPQGWDALGPRQGWAGPVDFQVTERRADLRRGAARGTAPQIELLPNGRSTAFVIRFGTTRCHSDGWTGLRCDAG